MSDTITVTVDGESRELFMSFGLLNELSKTVGDISNIPMIGLDPDLREQVLNIVLAKRNDLGKIEAPVNFTTIKLSMETANQIIDWVAENLMGFFVTALEGTARLTAKHGDKLQSLTSSSAGLAS